MTGLEITFKVLDIINYAFIALASLGFIFQLVYICFCWLPPKRFPHSEKKAKIAILIPARNEKAVIANTIKELLEKQTYPKELYDVYLVADNCTDDTAKVAEAAGAKVYIHNDPDPKTHRASYGIAYGVDKLLKEHDGEYDFLIKFDADNQASPTYLEKMNDAYQTGIEIARPFEASTNAEQNSWTKVSATYYFRDSRLPSNFRERLHLDSMLTGAGMMVSLKILKEIGGWDAMSMSDDAEFTLNRLCENRRVHYIAECIVYEDQPATLKDTYTRLARMGHGLHSLFWKKGFKLFGHFFVSGKWSNIDLFCQLLFIPISVLCCLWFPAYYIFYILSHMINAWGVNWLDFWTAEQSVGTLILLCQSIVGFLVSYYVLYALQTFFGLALSKKELGIKSFKGYWGGIFLSPVFMIFYGVAITLGVFSKPKWGLVKRNVNKIKAKKEAKKNNEAIEDNEQKETV